LAAALKKAKDQGVPKENIAKALTRVRLLDLSMNEPHRHIIPHQAGGGKDGAGSRLVYEALAFDSVGLVMYAHPSFPLLF